MFAAVNEGQQAVRRDLSGRGWYRIPVAAEYNFEAQRSYYFDVMTDVHNAAACPAEISVNDKRGACFRKHIVSTLYFSTPVKIVSTACAIIQWLGYQASSTDTECDLESSQLYVHGYGASKALWWRTGTTSALGVKARPWGCRFCPYRCASVTRRGREKRRGFIPSLTFALARFEKGLRIAI